MTTIQSRTFIFDYAEANNLLHGFDRHIKMAGVDWLASCRKIHNLSFKLLCFCYVCYKMQLNAALEA